MTTGDSFEDFYTGAVSRLLGQLFLVTGDLHEAEEVVQEAFARASVRWSRLRDYNAPEAWVRWVAMNLAADRARKLRRQAKALLRMGPPPEAAAFSVETLALVQALSTLSLRQRKAIVLHHLVGMPVEVASDVTGVMGGCDGGRPRSAPGRRCSARRGCWPPRSRFPGGTGSAGRTACSKKGRVHLRRSRGAVGPVQAAAGQPAVQRHRRQGRAGRGRRSRHQGCGAAADPLRGRAADRPRAVRRRAPVPGQVLRRLLPPAVEDGMEARARGRLRQGRPADRGVLDDDQTGRRL
jgi:RNA polymerase sigma-70 factor (ECF subfamily)